ncbi:50S ribosomal protein L30 [Spirochaeta africana]|uniref:Large ribosomal subunit protein uL30 n=1 Tax=Spirochaeta africana (strain ATCC 700263 / DSM 8902 / Z-7692) TaxID=889378 RepID=H9UGN0_SPIAZ|nr:50S ribosomal protein L30 [Spirochaeta africana]AFG36673.1 ribosomal protein L30, bacterial/organelle [Spirochaeta africana DSM 8902]
MAKKAAKKVKITLVRSTIGRKPEHKRTVRSLGLKRIGSTVEQELNPAIQGMIDSVSFMVNVEEL